MAPFAVPSSAASDVATGWARGGGLEQVRQEYHLLDRLQLLSPRTWYGIVKVQSLSSFNSFDAGVLGRALLGGLLPCLLLLVALGGTQKVAAALLASPWGVSAASAVTKHWFHLLGCLSTLWRSRSEALPDAAAALAARISAGRAVRTRTYHAYWPPSSSGEPSRKRWQAKPPDAADSRDGHAILLLPGLGIPRSAYAVLAGLLSDAGLVVAVASMEPLRFAHHHLGTDPSRLRGILREVEEEFAGRGERIPIRWHLAGHSAGSFAALELYGDLRRTQNSTATFEKVILCGCTPILEFCPDLSGLPTPEGPEVLSVEATRDQLLELLSFQRDAFVDRMPPGLTTKRIEGGTHEGYASYRPKWASPLVTPDDETIPRREQQEQTASLIVGFVTGKTRKRQR